MSPPIIICRVRREDAADGQANCFSRNHLFEVQQQIEGSLAGMAENRWLHLVAEVDGTVVGSKELGSLPTSPQNGGKEASMGAKPVILLDDGGVMNDTRLRGPQYQRLVGEFFAPRLGGETRAWAEANRICIASIFEPDAWQRRAQAALQDYASFERTYWRDWVSGMCQLVGLETLQEAACIELACQAETSITTRVQSAFPGAIEAISELHSQGYTLHTASGAHSLSLHGYLQAMGVREYFGRLYGSDLLQMLKETPTYYERLFADAQIAPDDALIVDDSPRVLAWARDFGATTVLINAERRSVDGMLCIASLAELPELIRQMYP